MTGSVPRLKQTIKAMKKIGILMVLTAILMQGFSQQASAEKKDTLQKSTPDIENTKVVVGDNVVVVDEEEDGLNIRVGNRGLTILESLEGKGPKIDFRKYNDEDSESFDFSDEDNNDREKRRNRFRGHWSGVEFGFNNYNLITNTTLPDAISYMKLNTGKSRNFNINFSQTSLGITRHFGLVSGLGLNWNNYVFEKNNNIQIGDDGYLVEWTPPNGEALKKSKFTTLYLNIPAMLEMQLNTGEGRRLNIAAGVIGGIKLGSHTKMVFENGQKLKSEDDLNLNILRGGVTARVGFSNFMIYGTYYPTEWFHENQGPGMYPLEPFEIGFAFTFND